MLTKSNIVHSVIINPKHNVWSRKTMTLQRGFHIKQIKDEIIAEKKPSISVRPCFQGWWQWVDPISCYLWYVWCKLNFPKENKKTDHAVETSSEYQTLFRFHICQQSDEKIKLWLQHSKRSSNNLSTVQDVMRTDFEHWNILTTIKQQVSFLINKWLSRKLARFTPTAIREGNAWNKTTRPPEKLPRFWKKKIKKKSGNLHKTLQEEKEIVSPHFCG